MFGGMTCASIEAFCLGEKGIENGVEVPVLDATEE